MASDSQLLSWLGGRHSDSALTELLKRYGAMVRRVGLRVAGSDHAADDVSQATFLLLVRRASHLGGERRLSRWLYSVALRVSRAWLRAEAREAGRAASTGGGSPLPAGFDRELGRLPADLRDAVVPRYLCGMSRREAASSIGLTEAALESRAARGLARLQRRLGGGRGGPSLSALTAMLSAEASAAEGGVLPAQGRAIVAAAFGEARASVDDLARRAAKALALARFRLVALGACAVAVCAAFLIGGLLAIAGLQFLPQ